MNLKLPVAGFPLGCAILSTGAKNVCLFVCLLGCWGVGVLFVFFSFFVFVFFCNPLRRTNVNESNKCQHVLKTMKKWNYVCFRSLVQSS